MKKTKVLFGLAIIMVTFTLLLTGCGGISQEQYNQVVADKNALQTQLDAANAAKANLQTQLDDINKIYPPGDFASLDELQAWASKYKQPATPYLQGSFMSALAVQQKGLEEGYLISVIFDDDDRTEGFDTGWLYNGAVAGGKYYVWNPEKAEVHDWYADFLLK